jgi:hypothetical protein
MAGARVQLFPQRRRDLLRRRDQHSGCGFKPVAFGIVDKGDELGQESDVAMQRCTPQKVCAPATNLTWSRLQALMIVKSLGQDRPIAPIVWQVHHTFSPLCGPRPTMPRTARQPHRGH